MSIQCIRFKHQGSEQVGRILANKGICWSVELDDGSSCMVQKKHVIKQWEELDEQEEAEATAALADAPASSLLGQLRDTVSTKPAHSPQQRAKTIERKTTERDLNVVTLKELCSELNLEPRIARRKLRKLEGLVGTGNRWEWAKDSEDIARVRVALRAE